MVDSGTEIFTCWPGLNVGASSVPAGCWCSTFPTTFGWRGTERHGLALRGVGGAGLRPGGTCGRADTAATAWAKWGCAWGVSGC